VRAQALTDYTNDQRAKQLATKAQSLAAQARKEKSLDAIAKQLNVAVQHSPALTRDTNDALFSSQTVNRLFAAPPGGVDVGPQGTTGNYMIALVSGIRHQAIGLETKRALGARDHRLSALHLVISARRRRFDLRALARRLIAITDWLRDRREFEDATIGYFSASTGTGAALIAAAELGRHVAAVVSRSGRPDLAGEALARVNSPTLLIVGSDDRALIELNELASARLNAVAEVAIVAGASHAFEQPGPLAQAAALASSWFVRHLAVPLTAK